MPVDASTPSWAGLLWGYGSTAQDLRHRSRWWRGKAVDAADRGQGEARGAVRRRLPPDRLRAVEPHQLGTASDRRADAVQVALARPARVADLAALGHARRLRRVGSRPAAPRQALVLGLG